MTAALSEDEEQEGEGQSPSSGSPTTTDDDAIFHCSAGRSTAAASPTGCVPGACERASARALALRCAPELPCPPAPRCAPFTP